MENKTFNALNDIQVFMTYENIIEQRNIFLKKYSEKDEQPIYVIPENGELHYYDSHNHKVVSKKFENTLLQILNNLSNQLKADIDDSFIFLKITQRHKYFESIFKTFDYIHSKEIKLFELFPICLKSFEEIRLYLNEKHSYEESQELINSSYFTLKSTYGIYDLEKIFEFLSDNDFINDEEFDFNDFYSVLNYAETDSKLKFECDTGLMAFFLYKLQNLFLDLTRNKIEVSERFITKANISLTVTNFDSAIYRIKKSNQIDKIKIEAFFKDNF